MQVQLNPSYQPLDFFFHSNRFSDALYQRDEWAILGFSVEELAGAFYGPLELIGNIHLFAEEVVNRSFSSQCAYHAALILRKMLCRSLQQDNRFFYGNPEGSQLLARQLEYGLQNVEETSPLYFEILVMIRMIHTATLHNNPSDYLDDIYPCDYEEEISTFEQLDGLLDLASQYLREKFEKEPIEDQTKDLEIKSEPVIVVDIECEPVIEEEKESLKRKSPPVFDEERPAKRTRRNDAKSTLTAMHDRQATKMAKMTPLDEQIVQVKEAIFPKKKRKSDQS